MELEKGVAEVNYTVRIPHISSYKELSQAFTADFPLCVNGLRTSWRLTITPFLKDGGCDSQKPVNRNIGISLRCLKCNVNHPDMEIYCSVSGRDQHEKQLTQDHGDELRWQGILVPRLALGIFKLLVDDQLTARLRFVVKGSDMERAVPSVENLTRHLRELHKTGMYSDMEVITSEGATLPAHRAILHARSSLLQKAAVTKRRGTDIATTTSLEPDTKDELHHPSCSDTPINSTFGSVSSGYESVAFPSPDSSQKSIPSPQSSPAGGHKSPVKMSRVTTPTSRVHCVPHAMASPGKLPSTPTKQSYSSSRTSSSKRLLTPTRISPTKRFLTPSRMSSGRRINNPSASSPVKRPVTSLDAATPRRRLYHHHDEGLKDDPPHPASLRADSPSPRLGRCSFSNVERTPLRELNQQQVGGSWEVLTVRVNMSTTVTQQLLEWIYTGECGELGPLARPLMVAGLRHGVADLTLACEQHLAADLTPTNTPDTLLLAHKYGTPTLQQAALQYAVHQAPEVTLQPSWASVAARAPTLMLEFSRRLALHAQAKE